MSTKQIAAKNNVSVLLVEDSTRDAFLCQRMVEQINWNDISMNLVWSERLSTALSHLKENEVNLIILDLSLPDSNGLETFETVHTQVPHIPVVVLTGLNDEVLASQTVRRGAQDYLIKGQFDRHLLRRVITYALERHQIRKDLNQKTQALQASEERLRLIIENNADSILVINQDGLIQFVNPATEMLFAKKGADLIGQPFGFPASANQTTEITINRKDGLQLIAEMRLTQTEWAGQPAYLASLRDITRRKKAVEALHYRIELETLITTLSTYFIILEPDTLGSGIQYALQAIGEFTEVDRSYIFQFDKNRKTMELVYQWAAADVAALTPKSTQMNVESIPWAAKKLAQLEVIHIPSVAGLPPETESEKEILQRRHVKSLIIIPMVYGKTPVGYLGFDSVKAERKWSQDIIMLLKIVGEIFVNALQRKETQLKLQQIVKTLTQRNKELALLNRVGQTLSSTLDLKELLTTMLEEARQVLNVVASSTWLIDPSTDELICWEATGPHNDIIRYKRLAKGQGICGWVIENNQSLIVPDTRQDKRHFRDISEELGLELRSLLAVPLRVKGTVIGAIEAVDSKTNRFTKADLAFAEALAAPAAIAIENARLYEQARQLASAKSVLLREVNHRVKNNLSAIIGLLYAEQLQAEEKDEVYCKLSIEDLIGRIKGLAIVHNLLSEADWKPLLLSDLTQRIVNAALQTAPRSKQILVNISPSSVQIGHRQTNNLALIINELATNTVKHTLPHNDTTHINIDISVQEDTICYSYQDDGPGYPPDVLTLARHNVGLYLVQTLVSDGLRGSLTLTNNGGATTTICFAQ